MPWIMGSSANKFKDELNINKQNSSFKITLLLFYLFNKEFLVEIFPIQQI